MSHLFPTFIPTVVALISIIIIFPFFFLALHMSHFRVSNDLMKVEGTLVSQSSSRPRLSRGTGSSDPKLHALKSTSGCSVVIEMPLDVSCSPPPFVLIVPCAFCASLFKYGTVSFFCSTLGSVWISLQNQFLEPIRHANRVGEK
ncbi:hypothetical protein L209DRAFT_473967 [Thermothelomyces heterothallicus CBS 203.75]